MYHDVSKKSATLKEIQKGDPVAGNDWDLPSLETILASPGDIMDDL